MNENKTISKKTIRFPYRYLRKRSLRYAISFFDSRQFNKRYKKTIIEELEINEKTFNLLHGYEGSQIAIVLAVLNLDEEEMQHLINIEKAFRMGKSIIQVEKMIKKEEL